MERHLKNMTILEKIVIYKKQEITEKKRHISLAALEKCSTVTQKKSARFLKALQNKKPVAVIAEIKRKSPSKGILRKNFNPVAIAKEYEQAGASALSVLTDQEFFGGSDTILKNVRRVTKLPILRKDFVIDEYQIYEAKAIGADAILLIAGILSLKKLKSFSKLAERLGLDCLFEIHTAGELRKTLKVGPKMLGINNRNLKTFETDIRTTETLAKMAPKGVFLVSESGIQRPQDLLYLRACGARAVLVGESLMRHKSPGAALKALLNSK